MLNRRTFLKAVGLSPLMGVLGIGKVATTAKATCAPIIPAFYIPPGGINIDLGFVPEEIHIDSDGTYEARDYAGNSHKGNLRDGRVHLNGR